MNLSATSSSHRVVMLAPSAWPSRGGVETHLAMVARELKQLGWSVTILAPPKRRPTGKLGLLWLWGWLLWQLPVFFSAQVIHIHDVFLWFWPVWPVIKLLSWWQHRSIKIITTFHGWEGTYPPTAWQRFNKWLAQRGSTATVAVGEYLIQFYQIHPAIIVYGGVASVPETSHGNTKTSDFVYLGRLTQDTGLPWLLKAAKTLQTSTQSKIRGEFWGDGPLLAECAEVGQVLGWVQEPLSALAGKTTNWVVASGYLTVLEALATGHRVLVIADNPLKQAYYSQAPFASQLTIATSPSEVATALRQLSLTATERHHLQTQAQLIQQKYSWTELAKRYLSLYEITV